MQVITSNQHQPQGHTSQQARGSRHTRTHQPARNKDTPTTRHEETPTSKARGSRRAGNHFQPGHQPGHTNQGHEVQGMQVTTQKNNLKDKKQQRKIKKRYFLYFCTSTKISLK